jgi:protein TonB
MTRLFTSWRLAALGALSLTAACSFTLTPYERPPAAVAVPPAAISSQTLDQYRRAVAMRIEERNPSDVLAGTPQAMLRSLVVVSFTVNSDGTLVSSAVYRTNGDDEAEATALASLRRASPLPPPPARLLNRVGQLEMMEDWLFNDNGKFQMSPIAKPQAQTID